jgi:hypothetical protein
MSCNFYPDANVKSVLRTGALLLVLSSFLPASSQTTLTAEELTEILNRPNVGAKAKNVQVVGSGPNLTVMAQEEASADERNLKIDAVFLAKALFATPSQVDKVKILFSQSGTDGRYVNITRQEINDYGKGKISAEGLLDSLYVLSVHKEKGPEVVQGPEFERRLLVWQRIAKLKQQGTGTKPFENIFREIEGLVTSAPDEVPSRLTNLETKVGEQEEQVRLARKAAQGRGVPAKTQTPQQAVNAPGAQGTASAVSAAQVGAATGYIPPEADMLKRAYSQNAQQIIRSVEVQNPEAGRTMRELKEKIDASFYAGRQAEGFALLHQFQLLAQKVTNTDPFGPPGGPPGGMGASGGMGGPGGMNGPGGGMSGPPGGPMGEGGMPPR